MSGRSAWAEALSIWAKALAVVGPLFTVLVAAVFFGRLYGPASAWNVGDIVVLQHPIRATAVPGYADALDIEATADDGDRARAIRLLNEAIVWRLMSVQVGLAKIRRSRHR